MADAKAVAHARDVMRTLHELYPEAECELEHADPFQLIVATVLSAQTTDKAVNKVTPALFGRFPGAEQLAAAAPEEVEPLIASIGLYRNKARAIVALARELVEHHEGRVPRERAALEALPGVGRKTANVVLSTAFGDPALAVDTHVQRLSARLGLSRGRDPRAIEEELTSLLPMEEWAFASHALIWHGRRVCAARSPRCGECALASLCPSAFMEAAAGGGAKTSAGKPAKARAKKGAKKSARKSAKKSARAKATKSARDR